MIKFARSVAILALVGTIAPPLLFLFHRIEDGPMKAIMLVASIAWFVSAPFWLHEK